MNCRFAREMIALWVGNDLTQAEAEAVSEHVEECPDCQQHVEVMMNSSDVLDSFKAATLQTRRDSIWPVLECRLTATPLEPAEGGLSRRSRSAFRSVGMLSVAVLTFAVAVLPDYVPRSPAINQFSASAPVSDVSTTPHSKAPERQRRLPSHLLPVYLDPSWQILGELADQPVHQENAVRRGSL